MSHTVAYIIWQPGHRFNELFEAGFRASPDELRKLAETGSLWDGKLPKNSAEFSAELTGRVTILWLTTKYSVFLSESLARCEVLAFEEQLAQRVGAHRIIRLDEFLLDQWNAIAGEEWFRSQKLAQHFLRWLDVQERDTWQEINVPSEGDEDRDEDGENRFVLEMDRAVLMGFADRLQESPAAAARAMAERLDRPELLERVLLSIANEFPNAAEAVATAALSLPATQRDSCLLQLANHADERVRLAIFRALTPVRFERPGEFRNFVTKVSDLLRRGARDSSPDVRRSLAGCAFGLGQAQAIEMYLLAELERTSDMQYRCLCVLALGGADGGPSQESLTDLLLYGRPEEAVAAVRALAARKDGHAALLSALADPREEVKSAAIFALAEVANGLENRDLQNLLARSNSLALKNAVAAYMVRNENTKSDKRIRPYD